MGRRQWEEESESLGAGVHRLPLPLPGDELKAVNVYVIESRDGLTLIDSGWGDEASRERLKAGLAQLSLELGDVRRVLVTHLHADHYGQATDLRRSIGAEVGLGADECEALAWFIENPDAMIEERYTRLLIAGAEEMLAELRAGDRDLSVDWAMPTRELADGQTIAAGDRQLHVLHTPGHTKGHVCFHEPTSGLFFSGDHVLPHITPSIGFEPKPTGHALGDFLSSLARVRTLPVERVLPAHGPVFDDLSARVDELADHHRVRLDQTVGALQRGAGSAYEVAKVLPWTRRDRTFDELGPFNRMLATLETLAHLELLVSREEVTRTDDGAARFAASASSS